MFMGPSPIVRGSVGNLLRVIPTFMLNPFNFIQWKKQKLRLELKLR